MSGYAPPWEAAVAASLVHWGAGVTQVGRGCWLFPVANGRPVPVTARLDEDFLLLDAPGGCAESLEMLEALLAESQALAGACKFALLPAQGRIHVRAEIVCDEAGDLGARVRETLDGFRVACAALHDLDPCRRAGAPQVIHSGGEGQAVPGAVLQALQESGWDFAERTGGGVAVELETPGDFHRVLLEAHGGGLRLTLDLARAAGLARATRQALSVLLLTVDGAVRLVRAFLEQRDEQLVAGFRVEYDRVPGAGELGHALAALSVAGRLCAREAKILHDEPTARLFLAVHHLGRTTNGKETNDGNGAKHVGDLAQRERCFRPEGVHSE